MDYVIMGAVAAIIVALLCGVVLPHIKVYLTADAASSPSNAKKKAAIAPPPICPVCRSPLPKGVDLYTKVFRPMNVHDQHCIIFGCPRCYPKSEEGITRRCPVCHAAVPSDGHLVARLFNKSTGKKHVTVTGCPSCVRMTQE